MCNYRLNQLSLVCSEKTRETSRYEYPADGPSGASAVKLMHSGWAGKYAGQAQLQYNPMYLLSAAAGRMVPMGLFLKTPTWPPHCRVRPRL